MEIGQKVTWNVGNKINQGIFVQYTEQNIVEIICYSMNGLNCHLRVFVDISVTLLKTM